MLNEKAEADSKKITKNLTFFRSLQRHCNPSDGGEAIHSQLLIFFVFKLNNIDSFFVIYISSLILNQSKSAYPPGSLVA
jgi:hypothetical protein